MGDSEKCAPAHSDYREVPQEYPQLAFLLPVQGVREYDFGGEKFIVDPAKEYLMT